MRSLKYGVRRAKSTMGHVMTAVILLVLFTSAPRLDAQVSGERPGTPATEAIAREAMSRLRSPVTPSHTLDMCPAGAAEALRDTVRWAAAEGQSGDQIVEGVIARYGEQMRILPKRQGAGLWAWIATPFVLLLGVAMVIGKLRALRKRDGDPADTPEIVLTDADERELAAALRELEQPAEEVQ